MKIKMIPLSQLARSPDNVRKTGSAQAIESLAASCVHGLLQNLQVRETAKDSYEVLGSAQRLAALKLLVKRKAVPKDSKIACNVIEGQDGRKSASPETRCARRCTPPTSVRRSRPWSTTAKSRKKSPRDSA